MMQLICWCPRPSELPLEMFVKYVLKALFATSCGLSSGLFVFYELLSHALLLSFSSSLLLPASFQ
jgi:hypothetical protein